MRCGYRWRWPLELALRCLFLVQLARSDHGETSPRNRCGVLRRIDDDSRRVKESGLGPDVTSLQPWTVKRSSAEADSICPQRDCYLEAALSYFDY